MIIAALTLINLAGFAITAFDKRKARKRQWRTPEKTFFLIALLGGAPGVYAGMLLFRHKTRHWYFVLGIPGIFLIQAAIAYLVFRLLRT